MQEAHNLYDLFHHRMMLHRRAYQNKTTTAVQLMYKHINTSALKMLSHCYTYIGWLMHFSWQTNMCFLEEEVMSSK